MTAVIQFFIKQENFTPMKISEYEYSLFNALAFQHKTKPIPVYEMFETAMKFYKYDDDEKISRMINHLIIGFYGVPLRSKVTGSKNLNDDYIEYVDILFS
jgi:hypothetical protein